VVTGSIAGAVILVLACVAYCMCCRKAKKQTKTADLGAGLLENERRKIAQEDEERKNRTSSEPMKTQRKGQRPSLTKFKSDGRTPQTIFLGSADMNPIHSGSGYDSDDVV